MIETQIDGDNASPDLPLDTIEDHDLSLTTSPLPETSNFRVRCIYVTYVVVTVSVTLICPGTRLWDNQGDKSTNYGIIRVETLFKMMILSILVLVSYFLVQGSDPGYLSKEICEFIDYDGMDSILLEQSTTREEISSNTDTNIYNIIRNQEDPVETLDEIPTSAEMQELTGNDFADIENNHTQEFHTKKTRKYCESCEFAPPLRSHHCRVCDRCVATFDHHCKFIATCIGERNHCRFYWFLTFQFVAFIYCLSIIQSTSFFVSTLLGYGHHSNIQHKMNTTRTTNTQLDDLDGFSEIFRIVVIVLCNLYIWPLTFSAGIMWFSHTFFVLANLTTFECGYRKKIDYLRGTKQCDLPFSGRLDQNIRQFCCYRDACWVWSLNRCKPIIYCWRREQPKFVKANDSWTPIIWKPPGKIIRDSDDIWKHPWQNKYYSCC